MHVCVYVVSYIVIVLLSSRYKQPTNLIIVLNVQAAFKEIVNQQEDEYEDELRQLIGTYIQTYMSTYAYTYMDSKHDLT